MGLLSARVYHKTHFIKSSISRYELEQLSAELDTWHQELPECLRLRMLTSSDSAASAWAISAWAKKPLLFMHVVHIISQITLYQRAIHLNLNQAVRTTDQSVAYEVFRMPEDIQEFYSSFARQLARIIVILFDEKTIIKRYWLTMYV